jgi:gamma-glutamyl hercynylcysteine S-oxide hydrolase
MCRHLAYLGRSRTLSSLLLDSPYSLYQQSWAPRRQRHGTVNADGFGVGWYTDVRPEPVRYRRAQPIWSDASFASFAPTVSSDCVLSAVRSATPGFGHDESSAAPFSHQRWLFSHNGRLADWSRARKALADRTFDIPEASAAVDSALLFGLAAAQWSSGVGLAAALAGVVRDVESLGGGGRLTMIAADGRRLAGVRAGEALYLRQTTDGVLIASEPDDDADDWTEIPEGVLVEVVRAPEGVAVSLTDLKEDR